MVLLAMVALVGCGGSLTCEVVAGKDNCFAEEAAALAACIPMSATPATLSADHLSCTFPDGVKIVFNAKVEILWCVEGAQCANITVLNSDGSTCGIAIACDNVGERVVLGDGSSYATWSLNDGGDDEVSLQCGSGSAGPTRTYAANPNDIASCEPNWRVQLPHNGAPPYTFSISGAVTFTCQ